VPHIYSEAISSSITGLPLVRPVFWVDPGRRDLMSVDDEYMIGGSILIAPVVEEHAVSKRIILPSGRWYNISDDSAVEGNFSIDVDLSTVPIFIREGSAVLRENGGIELHLYPASERRKSVLYINDGNDDVKVEVEFDGKSVMINPQKVPKIKAIVMHGSRGGELILNGETKTSDGIIKLK